MTPSQLYTIVANERYANTNRVFKLQNVLLPKLPLVAIVERFIRTIKDRYPAAFEIHPRAMQLANVTLIHGHDFCSPVYYIDGKVYPLSRLSQLVWTRHITDDATINALGALSRRASTIAAFYDDTVTFDIMEMLTPAQLEIVKVLHSIADTQDSTVNRGPDVTAPELIPHMYPRLLEFPAADGITANDVPTTSSKSLTISRLHALYVYITEVIGYRLNEEMAQLLLEDLSQFSREHLPEFTRITDPRQYTMRSMITLSSDLTLIPYRHNGTVQLNETFYNNVAYPLLERLTALTPYASPMLTMSMLTQILHPYEDALKPHINRYAELLELGRQYAYIAELLQGILGAKQVAANCAPSTPAALELDIFAKYRDAFREKKPKKVFEYLYHDIAHPPAADEPITVMPSREDVAQFRYVVPEDEFMAFNRLVRLLTSTYGIAV